MTGSSGCDTMLQSAVCHYPAASSMQEASNVGKRYSVSYTCTTKDICTAILYRNQRTNLVTTQYSSTHCINVQRTNFFNTVWIFQSGDAIVWYKIREFVLVLAHDAAIDVYQESFGG